MNARLFLLPGGLFLLILLSACTTFDYVGRSYTPTVQVDLYLDPADIDRPYEVMGMANVRDRGFANFERLQERAMSEARKKGADAVLIEFMDEAVVPSYPYPTDVQEILGVKFLKYEE